MTTGRELEFLGTLGKGGFGSVYLANLHGRDQFVRRVAVKVLRHAGDSDASLVARQRDEARLLGLLSHEGIVQVLDLTEIEGRPAVIMEYIEGADVGEIARLLRSRATPFSPRAAFEIVAVAAGALDVAWSSLSPLSGRPLNVIHRDIKPANLVVTLRGGVKVLDFGIARAEFNREGVTESGFFGTPAYMAPEFWVQEPIGSAYDIFALGVTLLELLTGLAPERAPMERGRLGAFMESRIVPLGLPAPATALLRSMLAFDGPDRPTAGEVHERATDLAPALAGEPVARLARAVVPELVEARSRSMDTRDLPSRTSLGIVSGPATGPAAGEARATARGLQPAPDPTDTLPGGPGAPLVAGGVALVAVALLLTSALAAAAWFGWPAGSAARDVPHPEVTAEAPATPVVDAAPAEPAPPPPDLTLASQPVAVAPPVAQPTHAARSSEHDPGAVRIAAAPRPAADAASPPLATAPASAPSTVPPSEPVAPPRRALSFGCTVVGAALQVDGVPVGTTPRASLLVAEGSHIVTASLGDRSCRRTISVGPDEPLGYICDMTTQTWTAKL